MRIAVQGCCHGELDRIYSSILYIQETQGVTIDLLIICGDFEAMRNPADLSSLACPPKYRHMGFFYQYYSGAKRAPVPTVFVGGNHEASNYMLELSHGGWVCPNIYFMGFAGCIRFGDLRIAGMSGIYKPHSFPEGHHERVPLDDGTMRSVYHIRKFDVYRLSQIREPVDVFLSHDWPTGIAYHGNVRRLLALKKHFRSEIESNTLGAPPLEHLLHALKPSFWFAAHMHVLFPAVVHHDNPSASVQPVRNHQYQRQHSRPDPASEQYKAIHNTDEIEVDDVDDADDMAPFESSAKAPNNPDEIAIDDDDELEGAGNTKNAESAQAASEDGPRAAAAVSLQSAPRTTKFLALDKCLPGRNFLQIVEIPTNPASTTPMRFFHDEEWLAIVRVTHPMYSDTKRQKPLLPDNVVQQHIQAQRSWVRQNVMTPEHVSAETAFMRPIPNNFIQTAPAYNPAAGVVYDRSSELKAYCNPQTAEFCEMLQIPSLFNPNGLAPEGVRME
nr:lariat debranching enzyme [Polyrhizophydium stewartii]